MTASLFAVRFHSRGGQGIVTAAEAIVAHDRREIVDPPIKHQPHTQLL
jgi:hypothetical protein